VMPAHRFLAAAAVPRRSSFAHWRTPNALYRDSLLLTPRFKPVHELSD
jgi:hypothetical protein